MRHFSPAAVVAEGHQASSNPGSFVAREELIEKKHSAPCDISQLVTSLFFKCDAHTRLGCGSLHPNN